MTPPIAQITELATLRARISRAAGERLASAMKLLVHGDIIGADRVMSDYQTLLFEHARATHAIMAAERRLFECLA